MTALQLSFGAVHGSEHLLDSCYLARPRGAGLGAWEEIRPCQDSDRGAQGPVATWNGVRRFRDFVDERTVGIGDVAERTTVGCRPRGLDVLTLGQPRKQMSSGAKTTARAFFVSLTCCGS